MPPKATKTDMMRAAPTHGEVLFYVERRERVGVVTHDDYSEDRRTPVEMGFEIVGQEMMELRAEQGMRLEFTYGGHTFVATAEPVKG